jgi:crotonobetainyl-CoA:carnitine CoA-transferase CaiB-like acyl-CoA transferase
MGLDIGALRAARPALVWASISGFGQHGPWRDQPAYDMIVQALSGVMSLTGETGRPAVRLGIPAGDMVAGMYAAIAINAALADRERTGQGRTVDVSMLDCQLAMLSYQSTYALVAGITPQPQGARHDSIPTYRSFVAGDGRELVITANTDRMWKGLCVALGREALTTDARFLTGALRLANREALWRLLEEAFLARSAADWIEPLQREGVPVALIKNVPEALNDARAAGRGMVASLRDPDGDAIEVVGNPIKFSGEAELPPRYPPRLGADAGDVLRAWLDMAPHDIRALSDCGALTASEARQA